VRTTRLGVEKLLFLQNFLTYIDVTRSGFAVAFRRACSSVVSPAADEEGCWGPRNSATRLLRDTSALSVLTADLHHSST
jgi:hypothetical protein